MSSMDDKNSMGFVNHNGRDDDSNMNKNNEDRAPGQESADAAVPNEEAKRINDFLFQFDSRRRITFTDCRHHTMIMGTTGSGKTLDFIIPSLRNHIHAGNRGLIADIKGTMRGMVRAIAREAGREGDLVEFGTAPSAKPCNILNGQTAASVYDFFVNLIKDSFDSESHNMDFHVKGAGLGRDAFVFLCYLAAKWPEFEPNLLTIIEMFNDPVKATELFDYWVDNIADTDDEEVQKFISLVRNNQFHILSQTDKKVRNGGSTHFEQMTYNTHAFKNAVRAFLDTPGVAEKFCAHMAPAIDMLDLLTKGALILLRFEVDTGVLAAELSRLLINSFYAAIYKMGISPKEKQSFLCIDEFQEVGDFSRGRFSDNSFVALAREFDCSVIVATQSASALMNRGAAVAVNSFISNINNKIFMFTDCPATREIVQRYDPRIDIIDLKPGEAFVCRYNAETREHLWGMEKLNDAYESIKDLQPVEAPAYVSELPPRPSLYRLLDRVKALAPEKAKGDQKQRSQNDSSHRAFSSGTRKFQRAEDTREAAYMPEWARESFSELFAANAVVRIPAGWRESVSHALSIFRSMDLGFKIGSITMHWDWHLSARCKSPDRELEILNRLLEGAPRHCMICGAPLAECHAEEADGDEEEDDIMPDIWGPADEEDSEDEDEYGDRNPADSSRNYPVCDKCLERHSLSRKMLD